MLIDSPDLALEMTRLNECIKSTTIVRNAKGVAQLLGAKVFYHCLRHDVLWEINQSACVMSFLTSHSSAVDAEPLRRGKA